MPQIVDAHGVWALQCRERATFAQQEVCRRCVAEELDHDARSEIDVCRHVDVAKLTGAELIVDPEPVHEDVACSHHDEVTVSPKRSVRKSARPPPVAGDALRAPRAVPNRMHGRMVVR